MLLAAVLALFLLLVVLGFPVFLAMGIAGMAGTAFLGDPGRVFTDTAFTLYRVLSNFDLVAVPLYILVGTLMQKARLSEALFAFAHAWFGGLRGGVGIATVAACAMFSAVSGSSVATAATIGVVALPALEARGYRAAYAGATVAGGGTLGILIPPSIAMIVLGIITEQSIGALFISGVVPGLLLASAFAIYTHLTSGVAGDERRMTLNEKMRLSLRASGAVLLPVFIFAAIYAGLATPTEVAALAVAYVLVLGTLSRSLDASSVWEALVAAARTTVMIFLLVGFGTVLTEFFTLTQAPQRVMSLVAESGLPHWLVVTLIIAVLMVLGMFLESLSMLLVTVPILFPLMVGYGIDPLAFGVFMVLAVETALITPPVGINLFTVCTIGKVDFLGLSRAVLPYILLLIAMMYLVIYMPAIATWLPRTMG